MKLLPIGRSFPCEGPKNLSRSGPDGEYRRVNIYTGRPLSDVFHKIGDKIVVIDPDDTIWTWYEWDDASEDELKGYKFVSPEEAAEMEGGR